MYISIRKILLLKLLTFLNSWIKINRIYCFVFNRPTNLWSIWIIRKFCQDSPCLSSLQTFSWSLFKELIIKCINRLISLKQIIRFKFKRIRENLKFWWKPFNRFYKAKKRLERQIAISWWLQNCKYKIWSWRARYMNVICKYQSCKR